jgi:prepilin-type N-terminal cleavage/methylation domain-containing protein
MGSHILPGQRAQHRPGVAGFSLIEVLVALAVLSISIFVFVDLFVSSIQLGRNSRVRELAATIAEDQLHYLEAHPDRFVWQPDADSPHTLFPVLTSEEEPKAGNPVEPPGVLPITQAAHDRAKDLYEQFRWKAFARLARAGYYELTTAVYWEEQGRNQVLTLTSVITADRVEALP